MKKNKIIIGGIVLLALSGIAYYFYKNSPITVQGKSEAFDGNGNPLPIVNTPPAACIGKG